MDVQHPPAGKAYDGLLKNLIKIHHKHDIWRIASNRVETLRPVNVGDLEDLCTMFTGQRPHLLELWTADLEHVCNLRYDLSTYNIKPQTKRKAPP